MKILSIVNRITNFTNLFNFLSNLPTINCFKSSLKIQKHGNPMFFVFSSESHSSEMFRNTDSQLQFRLKPDRLFYLNVDTFLVGFSQFQKFFVRRHHVYWTKMFFVLVWLTSFINSEAAIYFVHKSIQNYFHNIPHNNCSDSSTRNNCILYFTC